ncbi:MAG: hypothetical protein H6553_09310 [Chitinophagales bacterium]|nr:hypothetical protein [Chitinophagales bacterium]
MKQFRKYSEEHNTILLDAQYLFAYCFSDGFSRRSLSADFLVNYNYNYVLELNAFDHQKITKNNSDCYIEKGILKGRILELIENLLASDFNTLQQEYKEENFAICDIGSQQFFINLDSITKYIHITDGLPVDYFKSSTEKKLYKLNKYFKALIETRYNNWIIQ